MADRKIISIDGMGGDHAPRIVVEGVEVIAKTHPNLDFLVHGDEAKLKPLLAKAPTAAPRITIRHTDKEVAMDAKPSQMLAECGLDDAGIERAVRKRLDLLKT